MAFVISDSTLNSQLNRQLAEAKQQEADSLEKLSSGSVFTSEDPRPADRAIAEKMEFRVRSLSAAKRNINDAVSLLQTGESAMAEVNNTITRMKEINIAAASTKLSNQERRYLFIEYQALHDELNRVAQTTEFNGIPLLNGDSPKSPETLVFRIDDPFMDDDGADLNTIRLSDFHSINATTQALGLHSAKDLLEESDSEDGIALDDVEEMLLPEDDEHFSTVYDEAIARLSTQRAIFGALQSRLARAQTFIDVYQENIAAAKSRIADTDYAEEASRMMQAKIRVSATTALLAQGNVNASQTMQLLNRIL